MGFFSGVVTAVTAGIGLLKNKKEADDQDDRERLRTDLELRRHAQDVRALRGRQQVQFTGAGVRANTGTALDILADDAEKADLDAQLIEAGGEARQSVARSAGQRALLVGGGQIASGLLQAFEDE